MVKAACALLARGQSFEAICAGGDPQKKVSVRTLYRYTEAGIFGLANTDLPRKMRYKLRRTDRPVDRDGRSYSDFLDLAEGVRAQTVQMDTVIGFRTDFKCILTLHFPKTRFQLHVLLDECACECVIGVFDWIESIIGVDVFGEHFGTILTDRDIEFGDFESLECSCTSNRRHCRVYCCDAMASYQKGSCEKNHVELRRVLPKRTSCEGLDPYKMALISSRVNGYPRG